MRTVPPGLVAKERGWDLVASSGLAAAASVVLQLTTGQSLCPAVPWSMRSPRESQGVSKGAQGERNK